MAVRLVKEEPPARTRRGPVSVDLVPMLRTLSADPGSWYKYPREYTGYPNAMKKKFTEEGMEVNVASLRNDDGVIIGYTIYVRDPGDDGQSAEA